MKISLVTSNYPRQTGTFDQREINGLRHAGADIDVFPVYPKINGIYDDPLVMSTLEGQKPHWDKVHHVNGFSLSYVKGMKELLNNPELIKEMSEALLQYIRQGVSSTAKFLYCIPKAFTWYPSMTCCDHIVSFWGNYSGTVAYFVARKVNLPFSTYLHAGTDLYRDRAFLLEKLTYAKKIICVCQFNVDFLKKVYPADFVKLRDKILVHHLGLDLSRYESIPCEKNSHVFKVCCIGSLEKYKGSLLVLQSVYKLIEAGRRVELVFCGRGPLEKELKFFCKEHNIVEYVQFKGVCSIEVVKNIIQDSHCLVHGSPDIGDAVPTVIKEAMALGRPVVATQIAGIPELVADGVTGILVKPGEIKEMTAALRYLDNNRDLAEEMGKAGRLRAEQLFDLWRNTKALLTALLNE
jgi:glycosyltransferase involved in cell wall biosynthesis